MIVNRLWLVATVIGLLGCTATSPDTSPSDPFQTRQISQLLPADAILLGEQHDAPDHQRIHRFVAQTLMPFFN